MTPSYAPSELRAEFARHLADLYSREVPAYTTLLDVTREVNADAVSKDGTAAQRLGSIERVTAERHGAIRVGTPAELAQVARVFGAMGMHPTGFYDLREAGGRGVPVVSTAFRPHDPDELARNPFRVFTSLLAVADRRYVTADLARRLEGFLARRTLFSPRLLELADRAEAERGLPGALAHEFLDAATAAFALSRAPVDRAWYDELSAVSPVAADIGGVASTHINHLTPRVLDIDDLYARMGGRGIEMIEEIQGPPRWDGPDVLLRQTSFRALAERRRFREADGTVTTGSLRVRFGEVEARGIALTRAGRARYDAVVATVDARLAASGSDRDGVATATWGEAMPRSERELAAQGLGVFVVTALDRPRDGSRPPRDLAGLLAGGWVRADPVVYEDFLPRSAAGIFASNLAGTQGSARADDAVDGGLDAAWLAGALGRELHDPDTLYADRADRSLAEALAELSVGDGTLAPT